MLPGGGRLWGEGLVLFSIPPQHFAVGRRCLTHVHLVEMVHCAGVCHMLKDEIQDPPITGGNGQLLLASALYHVFWDVSKGVQCPQRSSQGDLGVTFTVLMLLYHHLYPSLEALYPTQ